MMKKIFALILLMLFSSVQQMSASEYSERDLLGFIDLDPSRHEDMAKLSQQKILDRELEEAISSSKENQDPTINFEKIVQSQNQEYISSLGLLH